VHALFTAALGLKTPWEVVKVELDTSSNRIDFQVESKAKELQCPAGDKNGKASMIGWSPHGGIWNFFSTKRGYM
jgi:hypothetical protein